MIGLLSYTGPIIMSDSFSRVNEVGIGANSLEYVQINVPSLIHICRVFCLLVELLPHLVLFEITCKSLLEVDLVHGLRFLLYHLVQNFRFAIMVSASFFVK